MFMGRKSHAIVSATFWGLKFRVKFCNLYKMFVASQRLYSCWPRVRGRQLRSWRRVGFTESFTASRGNFINFYHETEPVYSSIA